MKIVLGYLSPACFGLVFLMATGLELAAQNKPNTDQHAGAPPIVVVRDIGGEDRRSLQPTPNYNSNVMRGKAEAGLWAQVMVEFDTMPEWIDELAFQYYALCKNRKSNEYMLFRGAVSHVDIQRGRSHYSAMYLRPNTLLRYGEVVAVAVEILHKGEQATVKSAEKEKLPPEWWKNPKLSVKDGYLLNRNQTPFAFINVDDFEAVK